MVNDTVPTPSSQVATPGIAVRWRPDKAVVISANGAEVWHFGGAGPVRLGGRDAGHLAAAVDGQRSLESIIAHAVAAGMVAEEADRIARRWWAAGHLVAVTPESAPPRVRLLDRGECAGSIAARLAEALALAGLTVINDEADPVLTVVLVDDLLATAKSVKGVIGPVLAVQVRGERPLVSPLLHTDAACPVCLEARLRLRRFPELVAAARVGRDIPPPSPVLHLAALPLVAGVIASQVHALLSGDPATADQKRQLTVIDPRTGRIEHHTLVPVAACPACDPGGKSVATAHLQSPAASKIGVGILNSSRQDVNAEGSSGFRVVDPMETWERYQHLISDVVGIVPYVMPTGPRELRAFSAGANIAAVDDLVLLKSRLRSGAGGKGLSLTAARTGALAEALERDSLRARGNEPHRCARMADLDGAIHPNAIQLFSPRQLHQAEQLWALGIEDPDDGRGFHRVPRPFDTDAEHDWSAVADLRTGEQRWLPSSLLWFSWPNRTPGYPSGSSNGAAAGNSLPEALLQGLLELVERDAVALWWYPRCRRPAIDLAAWDDPRIAAALAPQRALGTDVWVLDLTTDLGIPAAVAIAVGVKPAPQVPLMGYGAHLDPVLAVVRALTELAQMQAPLAAWNPAMPLQFPGSAERIWFAEVTPEREPWLAPSGMVAPATSPIYRSLDEALDDVVGRITARGLEVLWADCTRPDIGLPVVRTWAPGLRHFWNHFGPGRLYDVPPAIGWRKPGYSEDDLNPLAMIL